MFTTASIAQDLQGITATNGWDAAFAMNLKQINALFFQQFLDSGPANPRSQTYLRCALNDESMWVLDLHLGPPRLSLKPSESKATVEMELITGVLITLDTDAVAIRNASWVRPVESKLTGSLELAKLKGEVNQLGAVVMDLGASAYTARIDGVDPKSVLNTKIGEAVQTFFHDNATTYTLGIIGNDTVSPALTPTNFHITTQHHPSKPDSCVLLLIQTNGQPGTDGPLPTYPIPDNSGVALFISERALFGALCDDLNRTFTPFGTKFSAQQAGGSWSSVGSGGQVDCGAYGTQFDCAHERDWDRSDKVPWTSDGSGNLRSVQPGLAGFTVSAASRQLVASWHQKHTQYISHLYRNIPIGILPSVCATRSDSSTVQIDFSVSGSPAVDAGSSKVSFNFSNPTLAVTAVDTPSFWNRLWGAATITSSIVSVLQKSLLGTLQSFTVLSIDAFRLKCLLFQTPDTVQLKGAALPKDVYLTGDAAMPISVTPASTTAAPGRKVTFKADGASSIMWELHRGSGGKIDPKTGEYTAPGSISSAQIAVVKAVDTKNTAHYGSAMVLVYQSPATQGVAVLPSRSLVTPGNHIKLYTTDTTGKPVAVNWKLSPNTGAIKPGLNEGEYVYTAPTDKITSVSEVTATATSTANAGQTGTAIIRVTPSSTIAVQPAQGTVKLGAKLPLTAPVTTGDANDLRWVVYPTGAGGVTFDFSDPTKATYTAPSAMPKEGHLVHIWAYLVDDQAAGVGAAVITLTT